MGLFAMSTPEGPRLITLDRIRSEAAERPREAGERPRGGPDGYRQITLWDPGHPSGPLAVLADSRTWADARPNEPPPNFPLVAAAPEGDTIAVGWGRGTHVALRAALDGQDLGEIDAGTAVSALALDAFGHLAVAGGGAVRLWDIHDRTPLPGVTPHQSFVRFLRFSPDGTLLAVAGNGMDVEIWDPAANTLVAALPTAEPVLELAFSPGGRHLAAGQPSGVALWEIVEPVLVTTASGFESIPSALAFDTKGRLALNFRDTEPARLWPPAQSLTTATLLPGINPSAVGFDAAGRMAVLDGEKLFWYASATDKTPVTTLELPALRSPDEPGRGRPFWSPAMRFAQSLSCAPDGRTLAVIRFGQVLLSRASAPDRFAVVSAPPEPPTPRERGPRRWPTPWTHAALASGGDRLYLADTGGPGGELVVWSLAGNRAQRLSWTTPYGRIAALALSPNGQTLALGDRNGGISLVETVHGTLLDRLSSTDPAEGAITTLVFSPLGDVLAAGTKPGSVLLYKLGNRTLGPPLHLPGHRGGVSILTFDTTGRQLASGGEDKTVHVWNLERLGRELAQLGLTW